MKRNKSLEALRIKISSKKGIRKQLEESDIWRQPISSSDAYQTAARESRK